MITFRTLNKVLWTDTTLFSHFGIYFRQAGEQPEAAPISALVRGTRVRHSPKMAGQGLGDGLRLGQG